ncbi:MAG: hypothetical protein ACLFV3_02025 [Phycisphaeraceae bacterium]
MTPASGGYNRKAESWDWYFAVGGYSAWGKGQATVKCLANGEKEYTLDFTYEFLDKYNWDKEKSVSIFGLTVTDEFMGDFHRMGLAKEFVMNGSVTETVTWRSDGSQPSPPPGGGGRGRGR